ncbi:ubiquitin-protein ligase E3B isoform X3 [Nasonia vitripennis]|uniref:HECT-type E3 ubiquitin transferase n=1 Tax=Nasonia vitripennis TaxID=7425 RepID=A0A7M7Q4W3_NASVI|nr:ubiquitin-protein ligase E3B isoform X3 [Nasonia vitripennis]
MGAVYYLLSSAYYNFQRFRSSPPDVPVLVGRANISTFQCDYQRHQAELVLANMHGALLESHLPTRLTLSNFNNNNNSSKNLFLDQIKAAREFRANEKDREIAACCIQNYFRKWLKHLHFTTKAMGDFDRFFSTDPTDDTIVMTPATQIFEVLNEFLVVYKKDRDRRRMENMYRYLVRSLTYDSPTFSYIGVTLSKDHYNSWILQVKKILLLCLLELKDFDVDVPSDYKSILLRLQTLVSFTSTKTWAIMEIPDMQKLKIGMHQLCANIIGYLVNNEFYSIMQNLLKKVLCKKETNLQIVTLTTISTLSLRPLIYSKNSNKIMATFLISILSVPALIFYLDYKDQCTCILSYKQNHVFESCVQFLSKKENLGLVSNNLGGNYTLCLLANLVHLANIEINKVPDEVFFPDFTVVATHLLEFCQQYVVQKQSNTTHWHPILGWFEQPQDCSLQLALPLIKIQISFLWTGEIIDKIFGRPLNQIVDKEYQTIINEPNTSHKTNFLFRTILELHTKKKNHNKQYNKISSVDTLKIATICSLFYTTLRTLTEMKTAILTGLCYKDRNILYKMWLFFGTLGPQNGLKTFLEHHLKNTQLNTSELKMLIFFADCMNHYITILDDIEMYEQQDPFKLSDLICLSNFLNQFLYTMILDDSFHPETECYNPLFTSLHTLLMAIYRRDCQKKFCDDDHWLAKEVRITSFLVDLEKGRKGAPFLLHKMPHIIPYFDRILLFRKYIAEEKEVLGLTESTCRSPPTTLIAVRRSSLVEDGYRQLAILPQQSLKGIIRVRFINYQGLDEAGIDQDGVFKEFLEEIVKKVFDPSFNLFKTTSENRLYPSSTSSLQENHLLLFEFAGRILGKAVYEGITVDVHFASFFVSQFCGQTGGLLYSCLDELASLDQDLYRSLTMVKHYKGDVSELELTFSLDENVMGKVITYELKPGGKAILVTNENKINYIHLVAQFRMYVQIKDQISAFTRGFRSIISPNWLSLFSTPEFTTSSSKSPLLGFATLEPPFSIRCIEVGDDEDTGDTIGSVIRGFFTIRKKDPQNRLPTSSTCFNLLKLPNYQKKCTLREKLRYAITSNTGFELS